MILALLADLSADKCDPHVAGETIGIGIVGIDDKSNFRSQRANTWIGDDGFLVLAQTGIVAQHADGDRIRDAELRRVSVRRPLLVGERLPQSMDNAFGGFALDRLDRVRIDARLHQRPRAIDVWVRHRSARVRLECKAGGQPGVTGAVEHRGEVAGAGACECMEEPMLAIEDGARSLEAGERQSCRAISALRRPTGMHPLGPRAFSQIFDDPRGHAAGDTDRIDPLRRRQAHRGGHTRCGAQRAENRSRMKARLMDPLGRDQAKPAHDFAPDRDARNEIFAGQSMALGRGEHCRNDCSAGMDRAAFERVVVVLAVRRGAVDQRGTRRIPRAGVADHRARAGL